MAHLQVALNGDSTHPAMPRTADEIARDAAACVEAGATLLHLHAFDDDGHETLAAEHVGRMLRAVRATCPGIPLNVTTFAEIVPDARARLALIEQWTELPDLVSANQGEEGVDDVAALLTARGVGVEACLLGIGDAEAFIRRGGTAAFRRLVIEPTDLDPADALAVDAEIEAMVDAAGVRLPQLHHGLGAATWAIARRAAARGHGIRTGIEDTSVLPDGRQAADNRELTVAAAKLLRDATS
jgi:uncharacterized protein (DUF849 family)